jgi:hypothetical protein
MKYEWKLGDVVRPADGSNARYIIIDTAGGIIRYRCMATGAEYTKDHFSFFCRYSTLEEYDRRMAELESEGGF